MKTPPNNIEEKASNCCNGEIDIVDNQNYGICTKCFTRIGYHDKKDNDKYDPHYIGFSKGFEEGYEKAKIIEVEEYKKKLLTILEKRKGEVQIETGSYKYDFSYDEMVELISEREHKTDGSPCWCNPKVIKVI